MFFGARCLFLFPQQHWPQEDDCVRPCQVRDLQGSAGGQIWRPGTGDAQPCTAEGVYS